MKKIGTWLCLASISMSTLAADYEQMAKKVAMDNEINPMVFHSVLMQESGDPNQDFRLNPNALNIGGRSHYPVSKLEAYEKILEALASGHKTVGIGLGQVEWKYHGEKFFSFWAALDPQDNLEVSAGYLREMIDYCRGDIACAVGAYHNRTPSIGKKYTSLVVSKCRRIYGSQNCNQVFFRAP
jgi:hypothetical protein